MLVARSCRRAFLRSQQNDGCFSAEFLVKIFFTFSLTIQGRIRAEIGILFPVKKRSRFQKTFLAEICRQPVIV